MIALAGLTRHRAARNCRGDSAQYAPYVDGGMLPNDFPDAARAPEYNTVDAALWYIEAVRGCTRRSRAIRVRPRPVSDVRAIVDAYRDGNTLRHRRRSERRSRCVAGVPACNLPGWTRRSAIGVITPRIGKPVEINALWYNALLTLDKLAQLLAIRRTYIGAWPMRPGRDSRVFRNAERGYCWMC